MFPPRDTDSRKTLEEGASQKPHFRKAMNCWGFTLVESVMAIGIVSFAMLSILGLIPVGLGTFRNAMNLTVETTIVQAVSGDLLRTDYTNLAATNFYFDQEGSKTTNQADRLYTAEVLAPHNLDAAGLVDATAASTLAIKVSNRSHPGATNSYFVIVPKSK